MVILALSHFDQTVVASRRIRVLLGYGYGLWSLRIVISRAIGIGLAVGPLLPGYCISGYITSVMAKRDCPGFIGRGLIADSRAVFRGYHSLAAGSQ